MKKKVVKAAKTPKYITIRIQYYPLPHTLIRFFVLFVFCLFIVLSGQQANTKLELKNSLSEENIVLHDSSFMVIELLKSVQEIKQTKIAHATENIPQPLIVFHGPIERKEIALTFDADMTPGMKNLLDSGTVASYYDKNVIDVLNSTQTEATLFIAGMWIETYPDVAKELAANPLLELASHSYSHPSFSGDCYGLGEIPDSKNDEEFGKTQTLLKNLTGKDNMLFRFPGGCYSEADLASAQKAGVTVIQWDVAGKDGFNEDALSIENNVIPFVKNGSIIVLHMANAPKTAEALAHIIPTLKARGYAFVTVSDLLSSPAPRRVTLTEALITP